MADAVKETRVDRLCRFTKQLAERRDDDKLKAQWLEEARAANVSELIEATSRLTSDEEHPPATIKALREAIISEIEHKNSERIVATMEALDQTAMWLTWVSVIVAIVGVLLAVVQVWQGFQGK